MQQEEPSQSIRNSRLQNKNTFLGHPKGLFVLFFTEMWERFSFYGMRFILILFLVDQTRGGFGWTKEAAYAVYGFYTMFVYLAAIPGGYVAYRYLGQKRAVLWGGIFQCLGHFLLAFDHKLAFFLGLAALVIGTGLLKSNISALVGSLYEKGDPKKDKGFSIFYMGINVGSLLAGLIVTTVAEKIGWHYGFSLAGIGMLIGMATFLIFQKHVPNPKNEQLQEGGTKKVSLIGLACTLLGVALFGGIHYGGLTDTVVGFIQQYKTLISDVIIYAMTLALIGYIGYVSYKAKTKEERDRMKVFVVVCLVIGIFMAAFEQAGGLMTIYTKEFTRRTIFGFEIPASAVQLLNPLFVVAFGALVSGTLVRMNKKSKRFNATFHMSMGNIIVGLGFAFMVGACLECRRATDPSMASSSLFWLVGAYLFHTIGELCVVPVVLSFVTNLAPKGKSSLIMGITWAVIGIGNYLAAKLGSLSESYGDLTIFQLGTLVPIVFSVILLLINNKVIALSHGAEEQEVKK